MHFIADLSPHLLVLLRLFTQLRTMSIRFTTNVYKRCVYFRDVFRTIFQRLCLLINTVKTITQLKKTSVSRLFTKAHKCIYKWKTGNVLHKRWWVEQRETNCDVGQKQKCLSSVNLLLHWQKSTSSRNLLDCFSFRQDSRNYYLLCSYDRLIKSSRVFQYYYLFFEAKRFEKRDNLMIDTEKLNTSY